MNTLKMKIATTLSALLFTANAHAVLAGVPPAQPIAGSGCTVTVNYGSVPDGVTSGLTNLSRAECDSLNLPDSLRGYPGISLYNTLNDAFTQLITPKVQEYLGADGVYYNGVSPNSANEILNLIKKLTPPASLSITQYSLLNGGFKARGQWSDGAGGGSVSPAPVYVAPAPAPAPAYVPPAYVPPAYVPPAYVPPAPAYVAPAPAPAPGPRRFIQER